MRPFRMFLATGFVTLLAIPALADSPLPDGWIRAGSAPKDYEMGSDPSAAHSGKAGGYLKSITDHTGGFGTLMQQCKGERFLGKRVRLSGWVKSENVTDWAGLWMRVDGTDEQMLAFDNMHGRPIKGTSAWKRYEIVLDVAPDAKDIAFGILLSGPGEVWVDDVVFEVVDKGVALTLPGETQTLADNPVNLDFESK